MYENRPSDALLVAETAAKFPFYENGVGRKNIQDLITWIKQNQKPK
jgi:hypothetical protein